MTDDEEVARNVSDFSEHEQVVPPGSRWKNRYSGLVYEAIFIARNSSYFTPAVVFVRVVGGGTRPWVANYNIFTRDYIKVHDEPVPVSDEPAPFDGSTWDGETPRSGKMVERVPNSGGEGG